MATTYTSTQVGSGIQAKDHLGLIPVLGTYTWAANFAVNDVVQMVKVPAGAYIHEMVLSVSTKMDTANTVAISVGDGSSPIRFVSSSNVATNAVGGGIVRISVANSLGYTYAAADTIDVAITTAPNTGVNAGTLIMSVLYSMEGFGS